MKLQEYDLKASYVSNAGTLVGIFTTDRHPVDPYAANQELIDNDMQTLSTKTYHEDSIIAGLEYSPFG